MKKLRFIAKQTSMFEVCFAIISFNRINGNATRYEYSAYGRLERVINADGNSESYEYDAFGNVREKTDGNGEVTEYDYDNRNNLTHVGATGDVPLFAHPFAPICTSWLALLKKP